MVAPCFSAMPVGLELSMAGFDLLFYFIFTFILLFYFLIKLYV